MSTRRRYVTADVFTGQPFGGNPLAVVLDADGLPAERMQHIAREFGYSETSFVLPPDDPAHTARVRIFTPRVEIPFAGHPNIGTAFVLARAGLTGDAATFEEAAGLVRVSVLRRAGVVSGAALIAPAAFVARHGLSVPDVAACAGIEADDVRVGLHAPVVASVGLPFVVAELASLPALRRALPDPAAFRRLMPCGGADALYLHVADPERPGVRHVRMFSPLDGVGEDAATGSAACALAGLLAAQDARGEADIAVSIRQGEALGRPSVLEARARKRRGEVAQVSVEGSCVAMMEGSLTA